MKKAIITMIVIIVLAAIAAGIFFLLNRPMGITTSPIQNSTGTLPEIQGSSIPGIPSGTTLSLGDAALSPADLSVGPPADAPQGATISFQAASGTIVLKNFYAGAQAYWAPLDALLITYTPAYALWYYRDTSDFVVEIPLSGTSADEDTGASALAADLGVSQQTLCELPVTAVFVIDRGMDNQEYPLDLCTAASAINPQ